MVCYFIGNLKRHTFYLHLVIIKQRKLFTEQPAIYMVTSNDNVNKLRRLQGPYFDNSTLVAEKATLYEEIIYYYKTYFFHDQLGRGHSN